MKILLLSPHTDDVEIGCGGTVIKFLELGDNILWVGFSTAENSLQADLPRDTLVKEYLCVINGLRLNKENYKIFNFPVRDFDEYRQEILEELVIIEDKFKPDMVIGPSLKDFHQDHRVVANEMVRAFKVTSSII